MSSLKTPYHAHTHLPKGSDPLDVITEITSDDGTVIITDPTGPVVDLSVPSGLTVSANIAKSGTQSITNGSFVPVVFDTELWDTGGMATLGTHNERLTVQEDGLYLGTGEAIWFANADSLYRNTVVQAYTSGAVLSSSWATSHANYNGENTIQNPSGLLQLTAGMYVRLLVYNGTAGSVTMGAVYLTLVRLGPIS